jgi:hypothetical protein
MQVTSAGTKQINLIPGQDIRVLSESNSIIFTNEGLHGIKDEINDTPNLVKGVSKFQFAIGDSSDTAIDVNGNSVSVDGKVLLLMEQPGSLKYFTLTDSNNVTSPSMVNHITKGFNVGKTEVQRPIKGDKGNKKDAEGNIILKSVSVYNNLSLQINRNKLVINPDSNEPFIGYIVTVLDEIEPSIQPIRVRTN